MIPAFFDYVRATSLSHVVGLLQNDPDGTRLLADGHTLIPTLKLRLASPALLIDIGGVDELRGIGKSAIQRAGMPSSGSRLVSA
jgi:carbon-monoxide dehydrogenase medium subunit